MISVQAYTLGASKITQTFRMVIKHLGQIIIFLKILSQKSYSTHCKQVLLAGLLTTARSELGGELLKGSLSPS